MSEVTRRLMMSGTIAMVATATIPSFAKGYPVLKGKIDTHQHFLPKVYVDAVGLDDLASVMPNKVAPTWSADAALSMMDRQNISTGIISISSGPPISNAPLLLRKCNDEAAELRSKHPGRFGNFASLPLPDVDASLKEATYALDTLKAEGVVVFSSYAGKYLGDPVFAPLFDELNRRKAVVFVHPNHPPYAISGQPPESLLEFPFDTTRTAASLILSGAMKRWPDIAFILSHAGGTLPYLAQRLAGVALFDPGIVEKIGDPMTTIRQFWFDTALSMSKEQLAALFVVADPAKITFGTDFPMAPPAAVDAEAHGLDAIEMTEAMRVAIGHGNVTRLFAGR